MSLIVSSIPFAPDLYAEASSRMIAITGERYAQPVVPPSIIE